MIDRTLSRFSVPAKLAAAALLASGCAVPVGETPGNEAPAARFETSLDGGGCRVEHVAVEPGTNQYQVDGLSPDGSVLAVGWDRGEEARGTYLLDLATGERTDLPGMNNGAVFAPSGETLVNAVFVDDGNYDVFVLEAGSGEISQLTRDESEESYASWSPDGETIVFASDRDRTSGITDLYLMRADGSEIRRLTDHPAKDSHPFFSPDGRFVYFNSDRDHPGIYRIGLDRGLGCSTSPE